MALYIYAFVSTAITIAFGVVRFCYWFKCRHIETCHNRDCRCAEYCNKYKHIFTDEEMERMQKWIDSL